MPLWQIITIGVVFVMVDIVVVGAVLAGVAGSIKELAARFPSHSIKPDAVRRNFQSVAFDALNLGGAVHLAADDEHLHVLPAAVSRWIGVKPLSIPWTEIRVTKRGRRTSTAQIGPTTFVAPNWCLDLAGPPTPPPGARPG